MNRNGHLPNEQGAASPPPKHNAQVRRSARKGRGRAKAALRGGPPPVLTGEHSAFDPLADLINGAYASLRQIATTYREKAEVLVLYAEALNEVAETFEEMRLPQLPASLSAVRGPSTRDTGMQTKGGWKVLDVLSDLELAAETLQAHVTEMALRPVIHADGEGARVDPRELMRLASTISEDLNSMYMNLPRLGSDDLLPYGNSG